MNEQEIYDKYGSAEFKARVQRECDEHNCPNWVSAPDDDYCKKHERMRKDPWAVSDKTRKIIRESDVEPGDRVEYNGHEWRVEDGPYYTVHLHRLDPDDPTQNITEHVVDIRDVTPANSEGRAASTDA